MKVFHLVEAESLWALSQRGSVNLPQVKELQDKLRAAGHDPGASDGWYGKKTAEAVRAYQEANGLAVDGDAGPQTLAKLGMADANRTPPAETPPEETPPAPAPRQTAREPADRPAATRSEPEPTTTRREPEQTTTRREPNTGSIRTARAGEHIRVSSQSSGRDLRNAIRSIPGAIFDWEQGSFANGIIMINLKNYVSDDTSAASMTAGQNRARQAKNQFLDFLRGDADGFSIFVQDSNGTYIMAYNNQTLDEMPTTSTPSQDNTPSTDTEPSVDITPTPEHYREAAAILFNSTPSRVSDGIGTFTMGGAIYGTAAVRMPPSNRDAIAYLGVRQSSQSGTTFSIYAFSISGPSGYRIEGKSDFADGSEALVAFNSRDFRVGSPYPLTQGSSQDRRKRLIMNYLDRLAKIVARREND